VNGTNVSGVAGFNAGAGPGTYGLSTTDLSVGRKHQCGYGIIHMVPGNGVHGNLSSGPATASTVIRPAAMAVRGTNTSTGDGA